MSKYKAGLHKDVSTIFNGVSFPKSDTTQRSSADPPPGHQGNSAPKPPAPSPQKLPVSQPPVQKPSPPGPLTQKLPVLQPPVRKPTVSQPTTQKLPMSQQPTQGPSVSESPTKKPSVSQPPAQKSLVPETSAPKTPASGSQAQKSPALSSATPAKSKTQSPPQLQSKEAPTKQPKADAVAKNAGQAQWLRRLEEVKSKLFAPQLGVNPTKQKATVIALPVLFIVLIFVFIRVFSAPSQNVAGPGKAGQTSATAASSEHKVDWQFPKPYPTTLRDPMQLGSAEKGQTGGTGGLIVKGIVYSKDNPTAVIDDHIVHKGDKISDVVITKINENSVEFEANGKKWMQNVQQ